MTEERNHAILFATTLLCARKLIETIESDKPNMAESFFVDRAIRKVELFKYVWGEFTPLSKPFKTKRLAGQARLKYPERQRKTICARCDSNQNVARKQRDNRRSKVLLPISG